MKLFVSSGRLRPACEVGPASTTTQAGGVPWKHVATRHRLVWGLTQAFLVNQRHLIGEQEDISANTRGAYRKAVEPLPEALRDQNLLHPKRDAGDSFVTTLLLSGATPSTIRVRPAQFRQIAPKSRPRIALKAPEISPMT